VSFYACGVSTATLLLCFLIPESPTHLINKQKIEKAKKSLARIYNVGEFAVKIS
jgi:hypothetical protein